MKKLKVVFLDFTGTIDVWDKSTKIASPEIYRSHDEKPKPKLKGKDLIQYFKEKQKLREKRGLHPQNDFYDNIDDGVNSNDSNWGRKFDKGGQYDFAGGGFHEEEAQRAHVREHGYGSNIHDCYEDAYGNMIPLFGGNDEYERKHNSSGLSGESVVNRLYTVGRGVARGMFTTFTSFKDEPNKECVKLLKDLLDKTGAKIVYSSTRRYSGWKKCADYVGLPYRYSLGGAVFGVTPEIEYEWSTKDTDFDDDLFDGMGAGKTQIINSAGAVSWKEREKEIKKWLTSWNGRKLSNYVILDDDPIHDKGMRKHWVPSIETNGFRKAEYKQALRILSK